MAIFNILRIPLFMLPMFFMETIKLSVSLKRIKTFLSSEDLSLQVISYENVKDVQNREERAAFKLSNATFKWDRRTSAPIILENLDLEVAIGELMAVVGRVRTIY